MKPGCFSFSLFMICLLEFLFWTYPVVSVEVPSQDESSISNFFTGYKNIFVTSKENQQSQLQDQKNFEQTNEFDQYQEEQSWTSSGQSLFANLGLVSIISTSLIASSCLFQGGDHTSSSNNSGENGKKKKKNFYATSQPGVVTLAAAGLVTRRPSKAFSRVTRLNSLVRASNNVAFSGTRASVRYFTSPKSPISSHSNVSVKVEKLEQELSKEVPPQVHQTIPASSISAPTINPLKTKTDEQIIEMVQEGKLLEHQLESKLGDLERAVRIRRNLVEMKLNNPEVLNELPFQNYDYEKINGQCCENVLGYVPIPIGVIGPLKLNGNPVYVPMATTEGCLVASTHRGAKAITESGGATSVLIDDGMTRAPLVRFSSISRGFEMKEWIEDPENYKEICETFASTGRFARLKELQVVLSGRNVYLRFKSATGDAMGMNMISKGCEKVMELLQKKFPDMQIMSLSGNYCTDKKPSAVNWIQGRGKSVVVEATIKGDIVEKVLKTTVADLVDLNTNKNLIGSIMAGSIGGFNAHASNIVTAIYLACGQDPAQNVESSNCLTFMESTNNGKDLYMSVTMPSIEVGTVGGGTGLPAQSACLGIMGVKGVSKKNPGDNPRQLAQNVAATVMAGELSLMSALAAGHLVKSHLRLNRKKS